MKTCKSEQCNFPVFGGEYCKFHQWKRTDNKKPKPIKKKLIKKKPKEATGELDLFMEIYMSNKDKKWISWLSGRFLPHKSSSMWINCFAHILPKGQYNKFRLRKDNIFLLHPEEHMLFDQGTEDQRKRYAEKWGCDWEKLYLKRDILKRAYNENKD